MMIQSKPKRRFTTYHYEIITKITLYDEDDDVEQKFEFHCKYSRKQIT